MRLARFEASGVGGIPDEQWDLVSDGAPPPVVVVTGPPGSGKSQWLRAIVAHKEAIAAYGSQGWLSSMVRVDRPRCKTIATWALTADEQRYGGMPDAEATSEVILDNGGGKGATADPGIIALFDRWDPTVTLGRMMSLPATRVPLPPPSGATDRLAEQQLTALANDASKLGSAVGELKRALRDGGKDPRAELATALVERFDVGIRGAGVNGAGELEVALRGGTRVGLGRASLSQVQAVATASCFAYATLRNGIILYDTPEAGLPPGLGARWLAALHEAEPSNQWIVATADRTLQGIPRALSIELKGAA